MEDIIAVLLLLLFCYRLYLPFDHSPTGFHLNFYLPLLIMLHIDVNVIV